MLLEVNRDVDVLELQADLSEEKSIVDAIGKVVEKFGRIDIAVNNVGVGGPMTASTDMTVDAYRKIIDIDLVGLWIAEREEIRQMLRQDLSGER